jgi:hypothetical protein
VTQTGPIRVPPARRDPAGPAKLAQGQPAFAAATVFTDTIGAWGDALVLNGDSYAELSPGLPGSQVESGFDWLSAAIRHRRALPRASQRASHRVRAVPFVVAPWSGQGKVSPLTVVGLAVLRRVVVDDCCETSA